MPFISNKFEKFHDFASATLEDIYTPGQLGKSEMFEVNHLASSILRNNGDGTFTIEELPRISQVSPGFGVVLTDFDGDGWTDAYLTQNFYTAQRETGRMAGGLSQLLMGDGEGGFHAIPAATSGLVVPVDAKGVALSDVNRDNVPDLLVGTNSGKTLCFQSNDSAAKNAVVVRLTGRTGNPNAVGARVTVHLANGTQQTAEVTAGGGYLSQSTPNLYFGLQNSTIERIEVVWPDGKNVLGFWGRQSLRDHPRIQIACLTEGTMKAGDSEESIQPELGKLYSRIDINPNGIGPSGSHLDHIIERQTSVYSAKCCPHGLEVKTHTHCRRRARRYVDA